MFLGGERKLENLKETHMATGRTDMLPICYPMHDLKSARVKLHVSVLKPKCFHFFALLYHTCSFYSILGLFRTPSHKSYGFSRSGQPLLLSLYYRYCLNAMNMFYQVTCNVGRCLFLYGSHSALLWLLIRKWGQIAVILCVRCISVAGASGSWHVVAHSIGVNVYGMYMNMYMYQFNTNTRCTVSQMLNHLKS